MHATRLSSKGQIVIPKAIRKSRGWKPGLELVVEDAVEGLLLRPARPFQPTKLKDVIGCTGYKGPRRSLKEMEALSLGRNEAFMSYLDGIGERARRGRTYSLEEIKGEFDLGSPLSKPRKPRGLRGIRIKGEPMSETIIKARG